MTDLERQLMEQLISAAWPLPWQITFALTMLIGYFLWSRWYFRVGDGLVRRQLSQVIGTPIQWVLRHSASYPTAFESGFARYQRWSWGIAQERDRTWLRDGTVALLSILVVNVLAGLWPMALFLGVALGLNALSYLIFVPACVIMLAIYAIFWSGQYEVTGMR
jgi:hypothetical protein